MEKLKKFLRHYIIWLIILCFMWYGFIKHVALDDTIYMDNPAWLIALAWGILIASTVGFVFHSYKTIWGQWKR